MDLEKKYFEQVQIAHLIHSTTKLDVHLFHNQKKIFQSDIQRLPKLMGTVDDILDKFYPELSELSQKKYLRLKNELELEYLCIKLVAGKPLHTFLFVGPFISETCSQVVFHQLLLKNRFTISDKNQLDHVYQALPILSNDEIQNIGLLLLNLSNNPFIESEEVSITESLPNPFVEAKYDITETERITLEKRYREQNEMMRAITNGDIERMEQIINKSSSALLLFKDRVKGNPLRSAKNTAIIGNTTNRIAAEQAGIHPLHLDRISEKYAILIEKTMSIHELSILLANMNKEYCLLVRKFSANGYSRYVQKTIDYIQINLGNDLSLSQLSTHVAINQSYLCRIFKQEVGMTISTYINKKRIEEAVFLLLQIEGSITNIAFLVGFRDVSYFSRTFKKFMGVTPKNFVKQKVKTG